MKVILTGGGTGGHIYPALAIGTLLQKQQPAVKLLYVGTSRGLEAKIVPKQGIKFKAITVEGLPRRPSINGVRSLIKLMKGSWDSRVILNDFNPDLIIATGGYVCGPVSYLGARRGVKLVLHEQNALPGVTNRILASKADLICTTFEESLEKFPQEKTVVTGLPVRPEILKTTREEGASALGIDSTKFIILVTGGSRGAKRINSSMLEVIKKFKDNKDIHIIHITGEAGYEDFLKGLRMININTAGLENVSIKPYLHEMHFALGCADLVIGRAGATFISEITAKGIPSILIPYPYAAENHQEANARSLVKNGAAIMIKDKQLTGKRLVDTITELIKDKKRLQDMAEKSMHLGKPDAGEKIVKLILKLLE